MTRLTDPVFPPELLLNVIEAAVKPRTLYWKAEASEKKPLADGVFVWPLNISQETRAILQDTVARVGSAAFLVKIPWACITKNAIAVPPSLQGNAARVRRLVVTLPVNPRDGLYYRELNRAIDGMASLGTCFPVLKTCIFLLHVDMDRQSVDRKGKMLRFRNIRAYKNVITLRKTFIWLITAFLEHGPGQRKLIRFDHHYRSVLRGASGIGPLTAVENQNTWSDAKGELQEEERENEKSSLAVSAERVFEKAYMY